ncbi:f-box domain-containing protein [Gigaspora margarita]|uniref:F-box domain-containing protein n=1 Tax=Gigaspora margarita TaxID=4874 RepID=A0A8H3X5F8_GIGMA|nr:f-box domain-containing protein [Gigaspora margarita]
MTALPNECYYQIFNNLRHNHKNLFSCALVNRQWCRIIIPILWSEPNRYFKDIRLIKIFLLTLNFEEQALLIPFKINLPNYPKPLFEYTNYITSVDYKLYNGVRNWLRYERYKIENELVNAIVRSLTGMFLRTSKNLKYLKLNDYICDPIILGYLYENTTITSIDISFKSKAIGGLVKILYKNSNLSTLNLTLIQLGSEDWY